MNLTTILDHWDRSCQPNGPPRPPPHPGFSGAIVARVATDRGPLAVRGWPPGALPRARLEALHQLLAHVAGAVPVAVPIAAADGRTLVEANNRLWQLEPWLPGEADFHDDPSAERLAAAVATLAAFHQSARSFVPDAAARTWFASARAARSDAVDERLARLDRWKRNWDTLVRRAHRQSRTQHTATDNDLPPLHESVDVIDRLFGQGAAFVADQLQMASRTEYPCQPCLRDPWHDHLLWTGNRVSGLIDPAACRSDNVAIDLARLLGSLVADSATGWDQGLAAYQQHRTLSLAESGLVTVLDQSGVLMAGAVWLERIADNQLARPAPHVLARILAVIARMQTLINHL